MLSKQKMYKDKIGVGFEKGECSIDNAKQNPSSEVKGSSSNHSKFGKDHVQSLRGNRSSYRVNPFFYGYCFFCSKFGHKVSTCRLMNPRIPRFCLRQHYGFIRQIRCFKCNTLGHSVKQCKTDLQSKQ